MLTWAMVYLSKATGMEPDNYAPFIIAMGCDVAIFYFIASAFGARLC